MAFTSSIQALKPVTTRVTVSRRSSMQVRAAASAEKKASSSGKAPEFCAGLPGNIAPLGDFDPLNFTKGKDDNTIKRYREAELAHGRVSMLASLGFVVGENFNPLFDGAIKGPAIGHFQQMPAGFWAVVLAGVFAAEYLRLGKGWVDPSKGQGVFKLEDDYYPGDIGYDPLGLRPTDPTELREMQCRELNNGRLAMFAILGEIAQEEITGKELFNLQDDGLLNDANCPAGVICDILEKSG